MTVIIDWKEASFDWVTCQFSH